MKRPRWLIRIALLGALALVAAACAEEAAEEFTPGPLGAVTVAPDEPIKVAVFEAISGDVASLGEDQVRAVEIAVDDKGGELVGHPVELVVLDDGCAAEQGTTGAQRIVADPAIVGVVGTSCSGAAIPAMEILSEEGLTMISGSNTSPLLTSIAGQEAAAHKPGYFRTAHNDEIQGAAAANFVFSELGLTKAATIHDGDPYTEGLATAFGASFQELGGEVVLATSVDVAQKDMKPVLTEVAAAGAELVYFPIFQPAGDFIADQAKDIAGLEAAVLMGADGLLSDTYIELPQTEGMYFSGPAAPLGGAYGEFVAKYEEKYGEKPIQAFHAHAYDAFNVLAAAIEQVAVQDED
ncbi:MAG: branched-chain amino acid ABC transporter substrate-binding protein, partial [Actinobacteria bacterium]|nr:branched-chain amino acid ABC transporter substrate-binding protein [Actinomycetota bacterium]